eukprot:GHVN01071194.1.p1 GENE.GHVN01071194.1~~GHVN01071194.1.p1  ORF type:complete len:399 (+),score=67.10 GHVN01071194.1:660-1856(+)
MNSASTKVNRTCTLLLVDRREDPITPLLNQWTYQAMVHELIGLHLNRADMRKAASQSPHSASSHPPHSLTAAEMSDIVMSSYQDQFFEQHLTSNFGDLGVAIKKYVEAYQLRTKGTAKVDTIEDMQRFLSEYPEFKRLSGNVSKHVSVVHELSRLVRTNGLFEASSLEQDLACSVSVTSGAAQKQEHLRLTLERLRSPKTANMERLRLVLLYALRYENDLSVNQLKEELRNAGIEQDQVLLVDAVVSYAGAHRRRSDIFEQNKTFLDRAKTQFQRGFQGVDNVYTQHTSLLANHVTQLLKGKMRENQFPSLDLSRQTHSPTNAPTDVIICVLGGVTFEEARDVQAVSQREAAAGLKNRILLGGTTILNTRGFLADVSQLIRQRSSASPQATSSTSAAW